MTALERMRRQVKEIDSDLDVAWLAYEQKYAITQLLYNTPSVEEMTERIGREFQKGLREAGYEVRLPECTAMAYLKAAEDCIVFRLEDEDGNPTSLDERALARLREMAWNRRHRGLKDWQAAGRQMQDTLRDERERKTAAIWDSIKRDKVFHRVASDILWGLRPTRSVNVPATMEVA